MANFYDVVSSGDKSYHRRVGDFTPISAPELAAVAAGERKDILAEVYRIYQLDVAPYTLYQSDGSVMVALEETTRGGVLSIDADAGLTAGGQALTAGQRVSSLIGLVEKSRRGVVALLGDSISAGPLSGNRYAFYPNARGNLWHDWWFYLAWQRVRSIGCFAVGAKNLQHVRDVQIPMMLTRADVLPEYAVCAFGTNNLGDTTEVAWGLALQIYAKLLSSGITPILTTIPPNTAYASKVVAWNSQVRSFAAATGLPLVDRCTPVCVPGDETQWAASMSADGVHPNENGQRVTGIAVAADTTLAAFFVDAYPDLDLTTGITGASTDANNLAGGLWNAWTNWDVTSFAGIEGQRFWLDRSIALPSGTVTVEAATFQATGSARAVTGTFAATTDIEFSAYLQLTQGSFAGVFIQPKNSGGTALGSEVILAHTWNSGSATRTGVVHGVVKAPAGTTQYTLRMNMFGTVIVGAITARPFARLG